MSLKHAILSLLTIQTGETEHQMRQICFSANQHIWIFIILLLLPFAVKAQEVPAPVPILEVPFADFVDERTNPFGGHLYGARVSPDGTQMIVWDDGMMYLIAIPSGDILLKESDIGLLLSANRESNFTWSPDGAALLLPGRLVDAQTITTILEFDGGPGEWVLNGRAVLVHGTPSQVIDVGSGEILSQFEGDIVAIVDDATQAIVRTLDETTATLHWVNLTTGTTVHHLTDIDVRQTYYLAAPDGETLLGINPSEGVATLLDTDGTPIITVDLLEAAGCGSTDLLHAWSVDGERILINHRIYDTRSGTLLTTLDGAGYIRAAAWSRDGSRIITTGSPGGLFDTQTGARLTNYPNIRETVFWNQDETRVMGSNGRHVTVYTSDGEEVLHVPHAAVDHRFCANLQVAPAWSADGRTLLTWRDADAPGYLAPGVEATVFVMDDGLSLRAGPGLAHEVLERLPTRTQVTIIDGYTLSDGYHWWRVQTAEGIEGYAVSSADGLVTLSAPLPEVANPHLTVWNVP